MSHERDRGIPVVGRVAAGAPILAVENTEERLDTGELFGESGSRGRRRADFLLRVKGDSMTGAGILDGDLVAVRMQPEIGNGEIGVVVVNDEATVKRVYVRGRKVRLVAENPAYEAMVFDAGTDEVRIVGVVAGVIRRM